MPPSGPARRPTIVDVATAAGVAPSTVSRTFSRPDRVNRHTREHVMAVAGQLGYAPNPAAQALESGRTKTIALLVPDITNPYFSGVIKGAERAAAAAGLTLVLGDTQENPAQEQDLLRRLGQAVDGFVLSAPRLHDEELHRAAELNALTLVNRATPGIACAPPFSLPRSPCRTSMRSPACGVGDAKR
jgi:LacI family repressor for deo operon, udp, cdd, tsx, nupC, and nupG